MPPGWQPQAWLAELVRRCAATRYPGGVPAKVESARRAGTRLDRDARLCALFPHHPRHRRASPKAAAFSARGAARRPIPPSATCSASPPSIRPSTTCCSRASSPTERREPPDIDVDFEHERREEVIQYIYEKYGRHRAGIAATGHPLPPAQRHPRCRQGAGPDRGRHRPPRLTQWGSYGSDIVDDACRPDRARSRQSVDPPGRRLRAQDPRLPAPSLAACRRLRAHPRPPRRARADRQCRDGGPHLHRMGQGRYRRARPDEGRRAGARHADLHPQGLRPSARAA